MIRQKTIKKTCTLSGKGIHTGNKSIVSFHPAAPNSGIRFIRTDIDSHPVIKAHIDCVSDTSRGTTISNGTITIKTTEHILAALYGLEIDNISIHLNCEEPPIFDGSILSYVAALEKAVIVEQDAEKKYIEIDKPITYVDKEKESEITIYPANDFKVTCLIDYKTKIIPPQQAVLNSLQEFKQEFASARTFCFLHEIEPLLKNGFIKGGDLYNAVVFVDHVISEEEQIRLSEYFNQASVKILKQGVLNNVKLRFSNEPARHKLLDILGDLALLGAPIKGHIVAKKPGHKTNIEFIKLISKHIKNYNAMSKKFIPNYNPNVPPLMDINRIRELLPHRPPFLLVDKILEMTENSIVGLKNVTMNEPFFVGHFPIEPVMPGVLIIEAMAQTGGVFILSSIPDPENYITYFIKIENAKFRNKVVPGDTILFHLELVSPIRRGLCNMKGKAFVGNKIVTEAEMLAQIVRK